MTPEFNLSECFRFAQNFPHLNRSSMLLTTIVSASRYTTAQMVYQECINNSNKTSATSMISKEKGIKTQNQNADSKLKGHIKAKVTNLT